MSAWVIFDVNNLAWRAYHTTGGLKYGDVQTGVTYGVLREVRMQLDRHMTTNAVFCFDSKESVRAKQFPGYKAKRKARQFTDEEQAAYAGVQEQIDALKKDYLPAIGFKNRLLVKGFEADDMIAATVRKIWVMEESPEIQIISSDKDLYQLLAENVTLWQPGREGKPTTRESFFEEFGIVPEQWPDVKAVAGCDTDDIPGIKGVGEITAAKYFSKELTEGKKFDLIDDFVRPGIHSLAPKIDQFRLNLKLVTLPHEDLETDPIRIYKDCKPTDRQWQRVLDRLGIKSLKV